MTCLKPLPDFEGPKLGAFTDNLEDHDVDFIEFLGDDIKQNQDGISIKVRIDEKLYVLKVFHTVDVSECSDFPDRRVAEWQSANALMYEHHTNAFFNECRAFGRLKELGREELAVKAYGYLKLDLFGKFEDKLLTLIKTSERAAMSHACHGLLHAIFVCPTYLGKEPRLCILKDWIEGPSHSMTSHDEYQEENAELLPRMLSDLRELHECGVVVYDMDRDQYVNGTIVDFGCAATVTHIDWPNASSQPVWTRPLPYHSKTHGESRTPRASESRPTMAKDDQLLARDTDKSLAVTIEGVEISDSDTKTKKRLRFSLTEEQLEREASGKTKRWALEVKPAPKRRRNG